MSDIDVGSQRVQGTSEGDVPSSSYRTGGGRVRSTGFVGPVGSVVVVRVVTGVSRGGVVVVSSSVVVRVGCGVGRGGGGSRVNLSGYGGRVEVSVLSNDRDDRSRLSRGTVDQGCNDGCDHRRSSTVSRRTCGRLNVGRIMNRGSHGVEGRFSRPRCFTLTDPTEESEGDG